MKKLLDELVQKVKSQAGSQMTNYSSVQEFSGLPEVDFTGRAGFSKGGKVTHKSISDLEKSMVKGVKK